MVGVCMPLDGYAQAPKCWLKFRLSTWSRWRTKPASGACINRMIHRCWGARAVIKACGIAGKIVRFGGYIRSRCVESFRTV